jgi:hypothetical protein
MIAAALKHSDAIVRFGVVASHAQLREEWEARGAYAVALAKLSV